MTETPRPRPAPRVTSTEIVDYLASHRVFGSVPRAALQSSTPDVIQRFYKRGHDFFRTGDQASHVFAIISGLVSLSEDDFSGRKHPLYSLASGDIFGLAATILGIPRTRTATALSDTHVLLIRKETIEELQRRFPDFGRNVTLELCRLLCHSEKTAGQLALSTVTSRLIKLFLDIQVSDEILPPHRELALRVGCSRETITRILSRLKRNGLISVASGRVRILDRGKLRVLAG